MKVYFDQSLVKIASAILSKLGEAELLAGLFLREGSGKLTFISRTKLASRQQLNDAAIAVEDALGEYSDEMSVATPDDLFDDSLWSALSTHINSVIIDNVEYKVNVLDRRIVGNDWQNFSQFSLSDIKAPNFFFVSLKGGVGRSTALCVLAAHLAARGKRVLTVDLDIEAPGLGSMLLRDDVLPRFGVLDYLVESGLGSLDRTFISDLVAPSDLLSGAGRIDVIPAMGRECVDNPSNVLSKLSRAYLPAISSDGQEVAFTGKIHSLLTEMTKDGDYDVVLVDARAGMHETTAASFFGLPGRTLLFGIDQPQTYFGYAMIFGQAPQSAQYDWTDRFCVVEAKAPKDRQGTAFVEKIAGSMRASGQKPAVIAPNDLKGVFDLAWDENQDIEAMLPEDSIDHTYIYNSDHFLDFDPVKNPSLLTADLYRDVYKDFLATCDALFESDEIVEFEE